MRQRTILCAGILAALAVEVAGAAPAATPAETEKAIKAALVEKLGSEAEPIRVAFYDGKALLSGKVTEDWTKELAREVALFVPGVTKVENEIEAKNERSVGTGKMLAETEDASLETDVKSALHAEVGQYSSAIEVEVCAGMVSIRGNVPDAARHDLAVAAATKVKGVKKLIDLLRVAG
jgi:osmotically-inducible protein OsmY